jgi:hypothetical protein
MAVDVAFFLRSFMTEVRFGILKPWLCRKPDKIHLIVAKCSADSSRPLLDSSTHPAVFLVLRYMAWRLLYFKQAHCQTVSGDQP